MSSKKRKQARQKLESASTRDPDARRDRPARADTDADAPAPPRRRLVLGLYIAAVTLFAFTIAILYVAPGLAERIGHGGLQGLRVLALVLLLAGLRLRRAPARRR